MTIYYSLTFLLLASEMATFCVFVAPLPFKVRRRLFRFLSESPVIAKVAYGLKISFIFIAILFVDALQRMLRITAEVEIAKSGQGIQDDLIQTQDEYAKLKNATASNSRDILAAGDQTKEIQRLKKDLDTLKEQARSQAAEYDRLADQYNKEQVNPLQTSAWIKKAYIL
ncbi:B-cell receptor-associated protein 31-like-domain-containing protein [Multifurca ochricompacta]|uniref:B-cell receptor-associated protein 31-like-domain-containing protein n=1 Tax=Multifurca ochricompacta TaxID=376703 RepID=A0AAD4M2L0_9AGAM|nr:B-cell receptor-associated protein 31-like-domain-containing protein [Multifurca ochricompacta]